VWASKEEIFPVDADHEGMVKFADEKDKTFRTVVATVKDLLKATAISAGSM
jgi:hypothetical protein